MVNSLFEVLVKLILLVLCVSIVLMAIDTFSSMGILWLAIAIGICVIVVTAAKGGKDKK